MTAASAVSVAKTAAITTTITAAKSTASESVGTAAAFSVSVLLKVIFAFDSTIACHKLLIQFSPITFKTIR